MSTEVSKPGGSILKVDKADLRGWNPEDENQWNDNGKSIGFNNLYVSIPCLLTAFAVWMYWGVITVQMLSLGFPFQQDELFTLTAVAGLSGATLRIPSTFFIRLAGGRNTIFFTTLLLLIPAMGTGLALQDKSTPLWTFQLLALLSGIGGGNFASSMSNISFYFPRKMQGLSLGLNAGLGNLGVTTMQVVVPLVMTFGILGEKSMILQSTSGTLLGKIPAGTQTYIQNAGYVWVAVLIPLVITAWFLMNNIRDEHVSPDIGSTLSCFFKISGMLSIGLLTAAAGLWLILPSSANGSGLDMSKWIVLPAVIASTVFILRLIPGKIKSNLDRQYKIFGNHHTWVMTIIYTMTFGSFIGFAAAFPLAIKVIFGFTHVLNAEGVMVHDAVNANGPSALMFAWIGPCLGALTRPIGGMLADRFGGARVTQIVSLVMVASTLAAAYYLQLAFSSVTPEQFFLPFFLLFLILFTATGIGNGSTFRTIAMVFNKEQTGPVLGWTSAVAAYGAFIIPQELGEQIKATTPEYALYGFSIFYLVCVALNWWYYLRKGAEFQNP
ncbi:MAG: hypothetical protein K8F91_03280 [Candidatus Obscuribacterales bacterium]|nr:hypothetical protein [Candidatus Obscuribacterales bacterium]